MTKLSAANKEFYGNLKKVLKKWPESSLRLISDNTGYTVGSISWNLQVLKAAKYVKRDKKGRLVAVK